MQSKVFSRDSLHFRFATVYGPMSDHSSACDTDICTYGRNVMKGMLVVFLITLFSCLFAAGVGDFLAWLVAGINYSFVELGAPGFIALALTSIIAMMCAFGWTCLKAGEMRDARRQRLRDLQNADDYVEPELSVYTQWYRSFKEKTCFRLQLQ